MITALTATLAKLALQAFAFAALIIGAVVYGIGQRRRGRKEAKAETALEAAERYAKQRKAMDDAEAAMGDDPAVLRDSLRVRSKDAK